MCTKALPFLFLLCFMPGLPARAFGPAGHEIVATIAMQHLGPLARQNVQRILGATTPGDAANWMDEVRGNPAYDFMKAWHFINIEKGRVYKPGGKNNIVWALERSYAVLLHPEKLSRKDRKEHLMILFHLMGDLHQPLHVGYNADRGGNSVQVRFNGRTTDLHRLWDSEIIQNGDITAAACMQLKGVKAGDIIRAGFTPAQFTVYMNDSRTGLAQAYDFSGGRIDAAYLAKSRQVVMFQLLYGGLRLAAVLEELFGKKSL